MKYGIISDIHSNLNALESTLRELETLKTDKIVCLGDIVGYGPQPNECIELIRQSAEIVLTGNHDQGAIGKIGVHYFNRYAQAAIYWTRRHLTDSSVEYLSALPFRAIVDGMMLVHASPGQPAEWNYILSQFDAEQSFTEFKEQFCFIGHSHSPIIFSNNSESVFEIYDTSELQADEKTRYIINVGSVGQPRDIDPRAAYGIFDTSSRIYQLQRVKYDVKGTQKKMRKAGIDYFLIERLEIGQ